MDYFSFLFTNIFQWQRSTPASLGLLAALTFSFCNTAWAHAPGNASSIFQLLFSWSPI